MQPRRATLGTVTAVIFGYRAYDKFVFTGRRDTEPEAIPGRNLR